MVMCFAPTCKHYSEKHGCTFFTFPKEPSELLRWKKQIRREDKDPAKFSRICNCHFVNGDRRNGPTIFDYNVGEQFSFSEPEMKRKRLLISKMTSEDLDSKQNWTAIKSEDTDDVTLIKLEPKFEFELENVNESYKFVCNDDSDIVNVKPEIVDEPKIHYTTHIESENYKSDLYHTEANRKGFCQLKRTTDTGMYKCDQSSFQSVHRSTLQMHLLRHTDTRYWSKDFMIQFIEMYKSYPCLWKIRCKDYTNKNLKNAAYEQLIALCKKNIYEDANRDYVVKKIQSMRGSFRKEMKKLLESKRSGSSADDAYVPSLWYFDLMLFTKDQELPTSNINNMNQTTELENSEDQEQDGEDVSLSEMPKPSEIKENSARNEISNTTSTMKQMDNKIQKGKKRQQSISAALNPQIGQSDITEFEAVGISVAKKLQRMDPMQAIFAESIINVVLRRGLLKNLSEQTNLCDGQCKVSLTSPRPPSAFSYSSEDITQASNTNSLLWQPTYYTQFAHAADNNHSQNVTSLQAATNDTATSFYT